MRLIALLQTEHTRFMQGVCLFVGLCVVFVFSSVSM